MTAIDDGLRHQILTDLAADPLLKGCKIRVNVADAVVTLTGSVVNDNCKALAEAVAKNREGVLKVINQL